MEKQDLRLIAETLAFASGYIQQDTVGYRSERINQLLDDMKKAIEAVHKEEEKNDNR